MAKPFALYLHIPFCTSKCPYCDFNSYEWEKFSDDKLTLEQRYIQALLKELAFYAADDRWRSRSISSIFFGGGTPSLLSADSISTILSTIGEAFHLNPDVEITLEANPGSVSEKLAIDRLTGFRSAGVNRISFGVQSFNRDKLKFLGRLHTPDDTLSAIDNIKQAGFNNFNIDLIFGCADETAESWLRDIHQAIDLEPNHLSCYSLTIEPGTVFGKLHQQGKLPTLDESTSAELFSLTYETLARHGFARYEISNFAKAGFECRHNISYWCGDDYLGLGAGAHSFCSPLQRWINLPGPIHYIDATTKSSPPVSRSELVTPEQARLEFLFLSLRTSDGIDLAVYREKFGADFLTDRRDEISRLTQLKLIDLSENVLKLTAEGFLFTDEVLKSLC